MGRVFRGRYRIPACAAVLSFLTSPVASGQAVPSFMKFQETERLADGLYAFRQGAYRSLFLVSDEGVIITDPGPSSSTKLNLNYQTVGRLTKRLFGL